MPDEPPETGNAEPEADTLADSAETLRKESEAHRDRAQAAEERAEALARRLHSALVAATNRLENPAELAFDAAHLDDTDALTAAIDQVLTERPYVAKRLVTGDAGQGARGQSAAAPTFADLFRA